ncbi:RNA polymerase II [Lysinibacillus sp. 54212]|uniref:RNA polymerase II n=1 Tax=Lysinibacillus sp. 54212 TaxID=3119829 RepID=UPI002FC6D6EE
MKFAMSVFTVLVVLVSAMLIVQYRVYSDQSIANEDEFQYSQEIEIVYREKSLDIRHHFKNLSNESISIQWPDQAVEADCFLETEYSCARLSEDKKAFASGENRAQSISYIIPLKDGLTSKQLLKDIFVTLENGNVKFSTVHISTENTIAGQWVTGLPVIGQQSLALVNYTMFSGTGQVSDLYWQAGDFALQKNSEVVSIYSNYATSPDFNKALDGLNLISDEHIAIVHGTNLAGVQGNRILFLQDLTIDSMQKAIVMSHVKSMYRFGDSPAWLKEVVAMNLTGDTFGSDRAIKIVETLTNQMSEQQLADWTDRLKKLQGEKISPAILDNTLSEVFGNYTKYLSLNETSEQVYPFVFNDKREIALNRDKLKNVHIIYTDNKIFYSADALFKELGYTTSEGPNGYYVTSEARKFRFPDKEHGFYVYNQQRFNTVSQPIVKIAGKYYIEESWLQRLFLVEMNKTEDSVNITSLATQE